ncbi:MAG: hypothetical protein ACW98F_11485 [Candidatus Hodarchaeales archaeon]|jgi:hypothetical protein
MSDNHNIDLTAVKAKKDSPFKLEMSETNFSFTGNLGKLEQVSFIEDILTFKFDKGCLRIAFSHEEIDHYFSIKEIKKE